MGKDGYDILNQHIGSYINIDEDVTVETFDKIEPLPKSIGVLLIQVMAAPLSSSYWRLNKAKSKVVWANYRRCTRYF